MIVGSASVGGKRINANDIGINANGGEPRGLNPSAWDHLIYHPRANQHVFARDRSALLMSFPSCLCGSSGCVILGLRYGRSVKFVLLPNSLLTILQSSLAKPVVLQADFHLAILQPCEMDRPNGSYQAGTHDRTMARSALYFAGFVALAHSLWPQEQNGLLRAATAVWPYSRSSVVLNDKLPAYKLTYSYTAISIDTFKLSWVFA